ncbi:hypothetical protein [Fimbriiglobus ruber]|uniref:Lipoprotein n=1 Tax=Fimbriiglobus ruber TaxID=1908690 RepID=A0A225D749_9BACT|nr:hypothetical protein [Fimbriiglobus ruber]OWK36793.1 hypothetical protein FRUB_09356 [Fimbriiglobus ruber]
MTRRLLLGAGLVAVPALLASTGMGQEKKEVAPGQPVTITVTTAAAAPDVSISLNKRDAKVTPCRNGCNHTGGGNIDVQQPSPDTLVVTLTGVAVAHGSPAGPATASLIGELVQSFDISFDKPTVKTAKLTLEGRVIGFLRSHQNMGTADEVAGASISGPAGTPGVSMAMPSHAVGGGQSISVNDKEGPVNLAIPAAGTYCLTQSFRVASFMPRVLFPCKSPSAEFAPDPALDPLWISAKEPFKGASKKDLGFQVTVKVAVDQTVEEKKEEPKKEEPKKEEPKKAEK